MRRIVTSKKLNTVSLDKLHREQEAQRLLVPNKLRAIRWVSGGTNRCCNVRGTCHEERFEELFVAHLDDLKDPHFLCAKKSVLLSTKRTLYSWLRDQYTAKCEAKYVVPGYRVFCWPCFKEGQRWHTKLQELRS